ncbi:MAG: outer membrane protein transport protein [Phycisphaerae bacterium]|nr:outer membrane protein transport protein [Saprospiraceae bacterium]
MNKIAIMTLLLLGASQTFSQNASDVLRYSYLQPGGTARYVGAGGAFGALGAEFGAISQNPAGLALYRANELTLTPSLHFSKTEANLEGGTPYSDDKSKFGFDNIGLVFNTNPGGEHWKAFNFGIGYNRQADYNRTLYYEGDASGTIMNGFFSEAKTGDLDAFGSELASSANAIYEDVDGNLTYDFAGNGNAMVHRSHAVTTFGRMNEMAIAFAGNYDEKLMVGATVGIPFVNYRIEGEYIESDPAESVDYFDKLTYTEYLRSSGVGVNLKLGVIYKVSQALRLGAAFHTPTAMSLTDAYSNTFSYDYTDGNGSTVGEIQNSPDGTFDYKLRTPWRASASAAFVVKKFGFLSADVEWVDYAANRYNFTADVASQDNQQYEREVNTDIQRSYQQAMNVRLGGELALDEFRLRGGFNLMGKPEEGATGFNTGISAGAGVRGKSFFLDLGWRRGQGNGAVQAYTDAPVASTKVVTNDFLLTVGFKF